MLTALGALLALSHSGKHLHPFQAKPEGRPLTATKDEQFSIALSTRSATSG
jgi:hypothetical protein